VKPTDQIVNALPVLQNTQIYKGNDSIFKRASLLVARSLY